MDGIGPVPLEAVLGIFAAAAAGLLAVHLVMMAFTAGKLVQQGMLSVRWNSLASEKKVLDDISSETKSLQTKMNALRPITSVQIVSWGRLLNDISDSVPKGVWLRQIRFEGTSLTIDGSAISKMRDEMIITNNFVAALKDRASVRAGFTGIDVDSISRRGKTALSIADFSLKARKGSP